MSRRFGARQHLFLPAFATRQRRRESPAWIRRRQRMTVPPAGQAGPSTA